MSDTPRTDAEPTHKAGIAQTRTVNIDFARQLERELVEAREQLRMTYEEIKNVEALKRFAAFVIATERERCAKVCEEFYSVEGVAQKCAEAIRKGE
jgi:hypothetical protein